MAVFYLSTYLFDGGCMICQNPVNLFDFLAYNFLY